MSAQPNSIFLAVSFRPIHADRIPVKDRSGETMYYVSAAGAMRMLKLGSAIALGTKSVTRALQVAPCFDTSKITPISAYAGQHYSHDRETRDNPQNVWTLKRFPKSAASIFRAVEKSCIRSAA